MKRVKKISGLLLAMIMILIMALPVWADETTETYTITITNEVKDYEYKAYKIFAGDLYTDPETKKTTLSNISWGDGVSEAGKTALLSYGKAEDESAYANASELAAALMKESDAKAFAKEAAKYLETQVGTTSQYNETDKKYAISDLAPGYYLVKNTAVPSGDNATGTVYSDYIIEVVKDVTAAPKGDIPTTEKKIKDGDNLLGANEASIGDIVTYEITGTLPSNFVDYKEYYYVFTDTLSAGLDYVKKEVDGVSTDSVKVKVYNSKEDSDENAIDVTECFYISVVEKKNDENVKIETELTIGIQDIKALNLITGKGIKLTKDSKIVVSYEARLNENAKIVGESNDNTVKLKYYNDPNQSGNGTSEPPDKPEKPTPTHPTGETPQSEVKTYTTELTITKTDGEGNILTGAEFKLTGSGVNVVMVSTETFKEAADGSYWKLKNETYTTTAPTISGKEDDNSADYESTTTKYKKITTFTAKSGTEENQIVTGAVGADGEVTFRGLGAGTYKIEESKTPAGYNTIAPIDFTIAWKLENNAPVFTVSKVTEGQNIIVANNKLSTTIVNKSGSELPSTGGTGTTMFYLIGGILAVSAAVLLVTKRRMRSEE